MADGKLAGDSVSAPAQSGDGENEIGSGGQGERLSVEECADFLHAPLRLRKGNCTIFSHRMGTIILQKQNSAA